MTTPTPPADWRFQCPQCGCDKYHWVTTTDTTFYCKCGWKGPASECTAPAVAITGPYKLLPPDPVEAALRARVAALEGALSAWLGWYDTPNENDLSHSPMPLDKSRELLAAKPAPPVPLARPTHAGFWWWRCDDPKAKWESVHLNGLDAILCISGTQIHTENMPPGQWLPNPPPKV